MSPIRKQCLDCGTQHDLNYAGPCESCHAERWRLWCSTHNIPADPNCKKCEKEEARRERRSKPKNPAPRKRRARATAGTKLRCIACEAIHEPYHIGPCDSCGYSVCRYWCMTHHKYLDGPRCEQCVPKRKRSRATTTVDSDIELPEVFPGFRGIRTPESTPPIAPIPPTPHIAEIKPPEIYPPFDKAGADRASRVREIESSDDSGADPRDPWHPEPSTESPSVKGTALRDGKPVKPRATIPKDWAVTAFIVVVIIATPLFGFVLQLIVAAVACSILGAIAIDNAKTRDEQRGVVRPFVRLFLIWLTLRGTVAAVVWLFHLLG